MIDRLTAQIRQKSSLLCVGLDTDIKKIPSHLYDAPDPVFAFNTAIIDATHPWTVAYKMNTAFYEAMGTKGWETLKKTIDYLNTHHLDIFTIADAKRGDIGNTSRMYAKTFFEDLGFDAVTVAPYMGKDSVRPFLEYRDKFTILLALTSNTGAYDFQTKDCDGTPLFERVLKTSDRWDKHQNLMYVVGATKTDFLKQIRTIVPNAFLLVPGVGAQGGNLEEVCRYGLNDNYGLLINSSRGIIYASEGKDFAHTAEIKAKTLQEQMKVILENI